MATLGAPYAMLLYERYLGRPFAGHRDSVSELVGDVLESVIERILGAAGIHPRKTKRAEKIAGFDQAPDFIVPDEFNPQIVIEAKLTEDDGTARDKVTRVQHLASLSVADRTEDPPKFEVVACIAGRGFGVRREDMRKLLLATRGKVFTLRTMDSLVAHTRLRGNSGRGEKWSVCLDPEWRPSFRPSSSRRVSPVRRLSRRGGRVRVVREVRVKSMTIIDVDQTKQALPIPQELLDERRYPKPIWDLVNEIRKERRFIELLPLLLRPDGAALIAGRLPLETTPEDVETRYDTYRAWEAAGLWFLNQGRAFEAMGIFWGLYFHLLEYQKVNGERSAGKATPLIWISDCHRIQGHGAISRRFLMLALCEDAISCDGKVPPERTGVYYRAVWQHGISDSEVQRYAAEAYSAYMKDPIRGLSLRASSRISMRNG